MSLLQSRCASSASPKQRAATGAKWVPRFGGTAAASGGHLTSAIRSLTLAASADHNTVHTSVSSSSTTTGTRTSCADLFAYCVRSFFSRRSLQAQPRPPRILDSWSCRRVRRMCQSPCAGESYVDIEFVGGARNGPGWAGRTRRGIGRRGKAGQSGESTGGRCRDIAGDHCVSNESAATPPADRPEYDTRYAADLHRGFAGSG